jgi:hypothetical protein
MSIAATSQKKIAKAIAKLSPKQLRELGRATAITSLERGLTYTSDAGKTEVMPLLLAPALMARGDAAYLHKLSLLLFDAVRTTTMARATDPAVKEVLPLDKKEEAWLELAPAEPGPFIGRFDMNVDLVRGAKTAHVLEFNGCAMGGIHYGPAASATLLEQVVPLDASIKARLPGSMTDVWLEQCLRHALDQGYVPSPGREGLHIVWLEDRAWETGITEGPTLASYLKQIGQRGAVCDPRDLELDGDDITYQGRPVDIAYRGIELRDILAIEAESGPLTVLREAVRRNKVLSPLQGDLDHKSLLEVWSSERFAHLFTRAERTAFKKHVLWTRLLTERRTDDPKGKDVDLPAYARRYRTQLVLKPNRACGGEGILVGKDTSATAWDRAIARSLAGKDPAVVQTYIKGATLDSPVVRGKRILHERHFTNFGCFASPNRLGILGRAAPFPVVNVSRGGGVMAVLLV